MYDGNKVLWNVHAVTSRSYENIMAPSPKGNVAVLPSQQEFPFNRREPTSIHYRTDPPNYKEEKIRLQSFVDFPKPLMARQLAKAGFYYTKEGDKVRCEFCRVEVGRWEDDDDAMEEHKKWSKNCPFLNHMNVGNVPADPLDPPVLPPLDTSRGVDECGIRSYRSQDESPIIPSLEKLGIHKRYSPVHTTYVSLESRLASFRSWPVGLKMRPQELAEAGFFYTGLGDKTLCFQCGGGLRDWAETDDPWREHAYYFSKCSFVIQSKGREFINEVLGKKPPTLTPEEIRALTIPKEFSNVIQQRTSESSSSSGTEETSGVSRDASTSASSSSSERTMIEQNTVSKSDNEAEKCASAVTNETSPKAKESKRLDDARACKICFSEEMGVVFLPCGHLVSCVSCAPSLSTCAVCRQPFTATVRVFLS